MESLPGASIPAATQGIAIYLDPPSHHYLGDRIFKPDGFNGDHANVPFTYLTPGIIWALRCTSPLRRRLLPISFVASSKRIWLCR